MFAFLPISQILGSCVDIPRMNSWKDPNAIILPGFGEAMGCPY
jgi:hypothetical protein